MVHYEDVFQSRMQDFNSIFEFYIVCIKTFTRIVSLEKIFTSVASTSLNKDVPDI